MSSSEQQQQPRASVSISVFFDNLAPHGLWVTHPEYRYVFCPKVDAAWRPYTNGRWLYLEDYGWYFASDEPFAWAVYHYGRWFDDDRLGWCWVPGNAWAGAWVSWRQSDNYIGWAPLGPTREGFVIDVDVETEEPPAERWVFVPADRFLEVDLDVTIIIGDQQPDIFQQTTYAGPVIVQNNIVVNNIIDIDFVQNVTNQQVVIINPQVVDQPDQASIDIDANVVVIFSPQIDPPTQEEAPPAAVEPEEAAEELGNAASSAVSSASSSLPADASASVEASASASVPADTSSAPSSAVSSEVPVSSSVEVSSEAPVSSAPVEEPVSSAPAPESSAVSSEVPVESSVPVESAPAAEGIPPVDGVCPEGYELIEGLCYPIVAQ